MANAKLNQIQSQAVTQNIGAKNLEKENAKKIKDDGGSIFLTESNDDVKKSSIQPQFYNNKSSNVSEEKPGIFEKIANGIKGAFKKDSPKTNSKKNRRK